MLRASFTSLIFLLLRYYTMHEFVGLIVYPHSFVSWTSLTSCKCYLYTFGWFCCLIALPLPGDSETIKNYALTLAIPEFPCCCELSTYLMKFILFIYLFLWKWSLQKKRDWDIGYPSFPGEDPLQFKRAHLRTVGTAASLSEAWLRCEEGFQDTSGTLVKKL